MDFSNDGMNVVVPRRCNMTASNGSGNQMGSTNSEYIITISQNNVAPVSIKSPNRGASTAPGSHQQTSSSASSAGDPALKKIQNKRRKRGSVESKDHAPPPRHGGEDDPHKARKNFLNEAAKISNEELSVGGERPLLQRFRNLITSTRATGLIKVGSENSSCATPPPLSPLVLYILPSIPPTYNIILRSGFHRSIDLSLLCENQSESMVLDIGGSSLSSISLASLLYALSVIHRFLTSSFMMQCASAHQYVAQSCSLPTVSMLGPFSPVACSSFSNKLALHAPTLGCMVVRWMKPLCVL